MANSDLVILFTLTSPFDYMQDPCRPGVKDAVNVCQKAGVKVASHIFGLICSHYIMIYFYDVRVTGMSRSYSQVDHMVS